MALNLKLSSLFFDFQHFSTIFRYSRSFPGCLWTSAHNRQQIHHSASVNLLKEAFTATLLTLPAPAAPALHLPPADVGCR